MFSVLGAEASALQVWLALVKPLFAHTIPMRAFREGEVWMADADGVGTKRPRYRPQLRLAKELGMSALRK
jgi:hypothetical protein